MQQQTATLVVAVLGIGGTLGGIVGGHILTRSWQREQWIRDKRNEEFRELLEALAESFRVELTLHAGAVLDPDAQRAIVDGQSNAMAVIRSRIFTADVVQRFGIELKWAEAIQKHHDTLDAAPLAETFTEIRVAILKSALKTKQEVNRLR
jgi:hypothetical protein